MVRMSEILEVFKDVSLFGTDVSLPPEDDQKLIGERNAILKKLTAIIEGLKECPKVNVES